MKVFVWTLLLVLTACTSAKPKISVSEYDQQGQKMLKVVSKIINEPTATRLNMGAMAAEQGRVVTCHPVLRECEIYGRILSESIKAAKDQEYSMKERKKLKIMMAELGLELIKGKEELKDMASSEK